MVTHGGELLLPLGFPSLARLPLEEVRRESESQPVATFSLGTALFLSECCKSVVCLEPPVELRLRFEDPIIVFLFEAFVKSASVPPPVGASKRGMLKTKPFETGAPENLDQKMLDFGHRPAAYA
jgi:hypothetical protein